MKISQRTRSSFQALVPAIRVRMLRIGMGMVGFRQGGGADHRLLALTLAIKHLLWPALIVGIIWIGTRFFGLLHRDLYQVMFAFAIVPLAGNTVTMAVLLKAHPEKPEFAQLLSTLLSIVTIPFMLAGYGMERAMMAVALPLFTDLLSISTDIDVRPL